MFSSILFDEITVFCHTYRHNVEVHIRYIKKDGKLYLVDCQGCDTGYNGSPECRDCCARCVALFREGFSK